MSVVLVICLAFSGCGNSVDTSANDTAPAVAADVATDSGTISDFYEGQLENQDEEAEIWAKAPNDMEVMEEPVIEEPTKLNLRNQIFTRVSAFSEGLAWVQYLDDNSKKITSVINTNGDVIYTPEHPVDYYSDFRDGYAFYLYTAENDEQDKSIDNVVSLK